MVKSSELLVKFELQDLDLILRERRLPWFGHVEGSSGAVRTACDIQIDDRLGQVNMEESEAKKDCSELKLMTVDSEESSTWRSGVRSAMPTACQ